MKTKVLYLLSALIMLSCEKGVFDNEDVVVNGVIEDGRVIAAGLYFTLNSNTSDATLEVIGMVSDSFTELVVPGAVNVDGETHVVTSIARRVFSSNKKLTSIKLPSSLTNIGREAFSYCTNLTSVTVGGSGNPMTSIGEDAFYGCTRLTSLSLGNSVKSIGHSAFYGCIGLTSLAIPNSITDIDDFAFSDCSGLTSVTIGNSVTIIGAGAFYDCTGLEKITIPISVTDIGGYAFRGCRNLKAVYVSWNTPPSIYIHDAFYGNTKTVLYVPKGTKASYASSDWSYFSSISEY